MPVSRTRSVGMICSNTNATDLRHTAASWHRAMTLPYSGLHRYPRCCSLRTHLAYCVVSAKALYKAHFCMPETPEQYIGSFETTTRC